MFGLCIKNLFRNLTNISSPAKSSFGKLLEMAMFGSIFCNIWSKGWQKQRHGVAIGSSLGAYWLMPSCAVWRKFGYTTVLLSSKQF